MASPWDLTALVNAADARASLAERNLWLARLMEWLRQGPRPTAAGVASDEAPRTPTPVVRLRHLLNQIERHAELRERVQGLAQAFWRDIDAAALYADFGFGARRSLSSELLTRVQQRVLPGTPETRDLAALFALLFQPDDERWLQAVDEPTLQRAAVLLGPGGHEAQKTLLDAIDILISAVHAAGYSPALRLRMDVVRLRGEPFARLGDAAAALRLAVAQRQRGAALEQAAALKAGLQHCREAANSVMPHLEQFGVSVDIVYDLDQLRGRTRRIEHLVDCVVADEPAAAGRHLMLVLVRALRESRGLRALLARHYSLLARHVAERSAETGEHYITRDRDEYRQMLRRAAGGGAVIAGTTFIKFAIAAVGMTAFWTGFWAGVNYAASFVLVMLLHWTVATKQPAMTAPALAASLPPQGSATEAQIETFIDRVAQLIRSQAAGIAGNLALCAPVVLALQLLATLFTGAPLVGTAAADYTLHALSPVGSVVVFAAFTGVLLFASSLIAGWAENWFVLHRLDSAIAWNPRIVARLGAARALRWSRWWRANISGLAANVSLGMMLGVVPAMAAFFALPLEVRHVTLSTGQLAAATGALGPSLLTEPVFWWSVLGIALTGLLNVSISFWLAFKVALRSRGVQLGERSRIAAALRRRLRQQPMSFLWPPKPADPVGQGRDGVA